jgi:hypothetical protein
MSRTIPCTTYIFNETSGIFQSVVAIDAILDTDVLATPLGATDDELSADGGVADAHQ